MPQVDWIEANRESLKSAIQKPWTGLFDSGRIGYHTACFVQLQHKDTSQSLHVSLWITRLTEQPELKELFQLEADPITWLPLFIEELQRSCPELEKPTTRSNSASFVCTVALDAQLPMEELTNRLEHVLNAFHHVLKAPMEQLHGGRRRDVTTGHNSPTASTPSWLEIVKWAFEARTRVCGTITNRSRRAVAWRPAPLSSKVVTGGLDDI
jgi:hypothetical protein